MKIYIYISYLFIILILELKADDCFGRTYHIGNIPVMISITQLCRKIAKQNILKFRL